MSHLLADAFRADPRVLEARRLILEALADHQAEIRGIRGPEPGLQTTYEELVTSFGELRGGPLFYPYLGSGFGRGPLVELADGSVKYDFISGIGVHHWGHSHPLAVDAALDAALRDTIMQGNLQQNLESHGLAKILLDTADAGGAELKHCFLCTSGAMANENALKLLFHKKPTAERVLAFEGCFAGRTMVLSQVTDKPAYREGLPCLIPVDYIPFFDPSLPDESRHASTDRLKRYLSRYPGRYAGMFFELVQGEGGFNVGTRDFFVELMEVLEDAGVPIVLDEVQTFGRTTEPFAFRHFGLDRFVDIVTVGKVTQVCATLFKGELKPSAGLLSQTFTGATASIFAARAMISVMMSSGLFGPEGRNASLHAHVVERLEDVSSRNPGLVKGPYGIGGMVAFTPFDGDAEKVKALIHTLFREGVIAFSCGSAPTRVRFLLPTPVLTYDHIDEVMEVLERSLKYVARET
ncbi:MAG: aminotransferase class III-fold pyridoxal phosphate-dependent enzyme [Pseudomonadota bacterium]